MCRCKSDSDRDHHRAQRGNGDRGHCDGRAVVIRVPEQRKGICAEWATRHRAHFNASANDKCRIARNRECLVELIDARSRRPDHAARFKAACNAATFAAAVFAGAIGATTETVLFPALTAPVVGE